MQKLRRIEGAERRVRSSGCVARARRQCTSKRGRGLCPHPSPALTHGQVLRPNTTTLARSGGGNGGRQVGGLVQRRRRQRWDAAAAAADAATTRPPPGLDTRFDASSLVGAHGGLQLVCHGRARQVVPAQVHLQSHVWPSDCLLHGRRAQCVGRRGGGVARAGRCGVSRGALRSDQRAQNRPKEVARTCCTRRRCVRRLTRYDFQTTLRRGHSTRRRQLHLLPDLRSNT